MMLEGKRVLRRCHFYTYGCRTNLFISLTYLGSIRVILIVGKFFNVLYKKMWGKLFEIDLRFYSISL